MAQTDEEIMQMGWRRGLQILALGLFGACGSNGGGSTVDGGVTLDSSVQTLDASTTPTDGGTTTVDGGTNAPGNMVTGTVTAGGTARPFTTASVAYWLGAPDVTTVPATVVYIFDHPVQCSEIKSVGWDTRITNGTQVLEMKMYGKTVGSYVVKTNTALAGEANVNYTFSSTVGTPAEVTSSSGTVTIGTIAANPTAAADHITGTFNLTYPSSGSLIGSYNAAYCPGGVEP